MEPDAAPPTVADFVASHRARWAILERKREQGLASGDDLVEHARIAAELAELDPPVPAGAETT